MTVELDGQGEFRPLLYRWDDIVLSFSVVSQLQPHSHGAAELVVSLGEPVCANLEGYEVRANSILIPPGVRHQNTYEELVSAVLYLDIESYHYKALAMRMTAEGLVYTGIPNEHAIQPSLATVYDRQPSAGDCYSLVVEAFFNTGRRKKKQLDPRVLTVVETIRAHPAEDLSVNELAQQVNLSEDHLHHLFTQELGLPLHKFRIWLRLKQASSLYFEGRNLTYAAHAAGFSDASHFSRTFARMYGAAPSRLLNPQLKSRVHFS